MKIISLNIWNGRLPNKLIPFFNIYRTQVDIFCLQEVFTAHNTEVSEGFLDTPEKIQSTLSDEYVCIADNNGLMICYKNKYLLKEKGITEVFRQGNFKKNLLWVLLSYKEKEFLIGNIHGIWVKEGREDTPERLKQSEAINTVFDKYDTSKILVGDFNLMPETRSIAILEKNMVNLIKKYDIPTTRTSLKKQTNLDKEAEEFADYIFVSPEIEIKDFGSLTDEVSDHYPLLLEI